MLRWSLGSPPSLSLARGGRLMGETLIQEIWKCKPVFKINWKTWQNVGCVTLPKVTPHATSCHVGAELKSDRMNDRNNNWQRRMAIQIAAQLPEDTEDALMVLELTRELVETFLGGQRRRGPL